MAALDCYSMECSSAVMREASDKRKFSHARSTQLAKSQKCFVPRCFYVVRAIPDHVGEVEQDSERHSLVRQPVRPIVEDEVPVARSRSAEHR